MVFTDIEGSTRLLEEFGTAAYREALAEHRRVVREACARHSGYEVDYEGDAFFYAFQSAQHAVEAIGEAMSGLAAGPIRIRVGIHTGEPTLDPPKYVGIDVHRAARIMSTAHGGQVVLSPTTVALLDGTVALKPLGEHRLKDMSAPLALSQLELDGLPDTFPPLKTLYRTNLPVPATPFLGRAEDVTALVELLSHSGPRLLTLTGPGGTGKTRLALQVAGEVSDAFPDGVTWLALAPLRDPGLLMPSLAAALDLADSPGEAAAEIVARVLRPRSALVVLDNVEHLLPDAAVEIGALVSACPALRLVATSRERLRLGAEREYPVDALTPDDAVALLAERAASMSVELSTNGSAHELVERLDRLPLAIELAAARLKLFTPAQLLARLGGRLDLPEGGVDADPRQRTLRATLEWSHDLLGPDEKQLFRSLSVFRGGCTLEAAEDVCEARVYQLQSLVDKSLVRRRDGRTGARFWMLETVRELAWEKLVAAAGVDRLQMAHAAWYGRLAEAPDGHAWSAPMARVDELEDDLDNFRATREHLVARGDAAGALQLALDLWTVWEVRDRINEGREWFDEALALPADEISLERGRALDARSTIAEYLGDATGARAYATEAVAVLRRLGDPGHLAMALQGRAAAERAFDPVRASAFGAEALELARVSGDRRVERTVLVNLGEYECERGAYERGRALIEQGIAISRELGDEPWATVASHGLAELELQRGELESAWTMYVEVADAALRGRSTHLLGLTMGGLAASAALRGDEELARRLWATFERSEADRGVRAHEAKRQQYAPRLGAALHDANDAGAEPLSLQEAVLLVRSI
jgi:predicted ATPase